MKRTGRLLVGFVGAAVTVAALAAPSAAGGTPLAAGAPVATANLFPLLPARCSYPPVSAPSITLSSSAATVPARQRFTLSGTVKVNSCGLPLRIIGLYRSSSATGTFTLDDAGVTNVAGSFDFSTTLSQTSYYKVVSAAGLGYNSASSGVVKVTRR